MLRTKRAARRSQHRDGLCHIDVHDQNTEKRGIIGAFCRAHTITDVLTHILSDRYTPTEQDDRYTFICGSTTGGLVVYDDKYAFSHHATDPAGGKLCNAFDLMRWHLFTPGGTAPGGSSVGNEVSSMSAMRAYAAADEATRLQLAEERLRQADEDFAEEPAETVIPDDASEPAPCPLHTTSVGSMNMNAPKRSSTILSIYAEPCSANLMHLFLRNSRTMPI